MISDLAPVDLLIQRAGRLQRHEREEREAPCLWVLAPPWSDCPEADWLHQALPGTSFVYRDTMLCWLTQKVLREREGIDMPDDARLLVESVYGTDEGQIPAGLLDSHDEQHGQSRAKASMATYNLLNLAAGYVGDSRSWLDERHEVGTRLSDEPAVNVVLLKRSKSGEMVLWADGETHAPMLSQLKLRESQARKLPELKASELETWEQLQGRYKSLRFTQPWLPEPGAAIRYDPALGCLLG